MTSAPPSPFPPAGERVGERGDWLLVAVTLISSVALLPFRPNPIAPGSAVEVELGVGPADATELQCAGTVGSSTCALDAQRQPVAAERPLRPFVTTWRQLVLVSGVFESAAAQDWLRAPSGGATFRCDATVISPSAEVELRFRRADPFGRHTAAALTANACWRVR
jgi:hypothetical protein